VQVLPETLKANEIVGGRLASNVEADAGEPRAQAIHGAQTLHRARETPPDRRDEVQGEAARIEAESVDLLGGGHDVML
jgi:hypothetical protein